MFEKIIFKIANVLWVNNKMLTEQDHKDLNMIIDNALADLPFSIDFEVTNASELYDAMEAFVLEKLVADKKYKITIEEME